ncbi:MAG: hypothetical protein II933_04145 [Candidatus Methanomethylophilaceae archaeon]|jgi:uncharacterized membrane protein|nr:DUF1634 domain-containing protein [Thermoplasmata archaeon]MBQ3685563.1 hypothetical protein [Candidatus Methanomethylophilaceae archaeon]
MSRILNKWTANAIRASMCAGLAALVIGLLADWQDAMYLGLGLMIASPLIGLGASLVALLYERDMKWAAVAVVLIAIVLARVAYSLMRTGVRDG